MTTLNLCKNCNYYTILLKEMEKHCKVHKHDYRVIHTNTDLGGVVI